MDGGPLQLEESDTQLVVRGDRFQVGFDKATGAMISYEVGGQPLLAAPLEPNFWKVPNDNQYRSRYLTTVAPWRDAARRRTTRSVRSEQLPDGVIQITVESVLPVGEAVHHTVYTVRGDGSVQVVAEYGPGKPSVPLFPSLA